MSMARYGVKYTDSSRLDGLIIYTILFYFPIIHLTV